MRKKFQLMKIKKNGYILKAGSTCNQSHFIDSGIMRAYTYDFEGDEVTTAFYTQNTFASDMLSFF